MSFAAALQDFTPRHKGVAQLSFLGATGTPSATSAPFLANGEKHMYCQLNTGSADYTRLFKVEEENHFRVVPDTLQYQLTAPQVVKIGNDCTLSGVRGVLNCGKEIFRYTDVYRGEPLRPCYYTSSSNEVMVRLVALAEGRIGVLCNHVDGRIGFYSVARIEELNSASQGSAEYVDSSAFLGATGSVVQGFLLSTGKIGCIGLHREKTDSEPCVTSFIYDPSTRAVTDFHLVATAGSVSEGATGGVSSAALAPQHDGDCLLYCVVDKAVHVVSIENPFAGSGEIVVTPE
ncbi:hypothetical protein AGDE_15474 [Angomonas deanei]|nr:hypothetical protein AGDE_15474 [Angomonas deanei]|eukprot:EPY19003.1 hypothetical protein AGDE_15474 [Angomonas deanei]